MSAIIQADVQRGIDTGQWGIQIIMALTDEFLGACCLLHFNLVAGLYGLIISLDFKSVLTTASFECHPSFWLGYFFLLLKLAVSSVFEYSIFSTAAVCCLL